MGEKRKRKSAQPEKVSESGPELEILEKTARSEAEQPESIEAADELLEIAVDEATPQSELEPEAAPRSGEEVRLEDLLPPDLYSYLLLVVQMLAGQAWVYLGLTLNPRTGAITRDLDQARLAIDTISWLLERIGEHIKEDEKRALETLLTNLRLNYVEQHR